MDLDWGENDQVMDTKEYSGSSVEEIEHALEIDNNEGRNRRPLG